jgi:hypothetical protein
LAEAVSTARKAADEQLEAGIDTAEQQAARLLLQNGQFEDTEEEVPQLLEEFYPAVEVVLRQRRSRRRYLALPGSLPSWVQSGRLSQPVGQLFHHRQHHLPIRTVQAGQHLCQVLCLLGRALLDSTSKDEASQLNRPASSSRRATVGITSPRSMRDTASFPIFSCSATCSWVNPACRRAAIALPTLSANASTFVFAILFSIQLEWWQITPLT